MNINSIELKSKLLSCLQFDVNNGQYERMDKQLSALSQTLLSLNLTSDVLTDSLSMNAAIFDQTIKCSKLIELKQINGQLVDDLTRMKSICDDMKNKLLEANVSMKSESNFDSIARKKIMFYEQKYAEYRTNIKEKEIRLKNNGFMAEISEKAMDDRKRSIKQLRNELNDCNERMKQYDFEPSEQALKLKIDCLKRQLQSTDHKYFN